MARRREDALTATAGLGGVYGARRLSHSALESAYGPGAKRPKVFAERKIITRKPMAGKGRLAAGAGLFTLAAPTATVGIDNLLQRDKLAKRDESHAGSMLRETRHGVSSSLKERKKTLSNPAPINRQAQSYGVGTLIGSAVGGLTGQALKKAPRLGGGHKAGIIGIAGVTAGAASLPGQDKLMRRSSRDKYQVTATGVRRLRKKTIPASRVADRVDRIHGQEVPARLSKAVAYPGSDLTNGQKRRRVLAAGSTPVVGDLTAAATAGRMAPPNLRRKTEALQLSGSVGGSVVGGVGGAYAGAALARKIKPVADRADSINAKIDEKVRGPVAAGKQKAATRISPALGDKVAARAAKTGPGRVAGLATSKKPWASRLGRAAIRAKAPLLGVGAAGAVLGTMAGQSLGSTIGSSATYGHALKLEDKQEEAGKVHKSQHNRHGSRVCKLAPAPAMSKPEARKQSKLKNTSAVLSVIGGTAGLGAMGAQLAGRRPKIKRLSVPLLTAGAGLGGVNSLLYAGIQRKEAKAALAKALAPRVAPVKAVTTRPGTLVRTKSVTGFTRTHNRRGVV